MMVRQVLDQALETPPSGETETADVAEARAWLARVEALIRRTTGFASAVLSIGPLELDTAAARVTLEGQHIKLTAQEYRALQYLMQHAGEVVSKAELSEHIYRQDIERDSNVIEVLINHLRNKLEPDLIETRRGLGYCLKAETHA